MTEEDLAEDMGGGLEFHTKMQTEEDKFSEILRHLVADVGLLKVCSEDKAIKFGGLGMRTLQECTVWIEANFKNLRYGLMMDPLLMLDRIFGADDVEA